MSAAEALRTTDVSIGSPVGLFESDQRDQDQQQGEQGMPALAELAREDPQLLSQWAPTGAKTGDTKASRSCMPPPRAPPPPPPPFLSVSRASAPIPKRALLLLPRTPAVTR